MIIFCVPSLDYTSADVNECLSRPSVCHHHVKCRNVEGSYVCKCRSGYAGNGYNCASNPCRYSFLSSYLSIISINYSFFFLLGVNYLQQHVRILSTDSMLNNAAQEIGVLITITIIIAVIAYHSGMTDVRGNPWIYSRMWIVVKYCVKWPMLLTEEVSYHFQMNFTVSYRKESFIFWLDLLWVMILRDLIILYCHSSNLMIASF